MRKKITALGLLLLSMISLSAYAQTYEWSIQEGATVTEFSEVSLTIKDVAGTVEGNYSNGSEQCGFYRKSDDKLISTFGWGWCPYNLTLENGAVTLNLAIQSDAVFPDYPYTQNGEYYVKIYKGFFRYDMNWDTNTWTDSEEIRVNFTIQAEPKFLNKENTTITPEQGDLKICPDQWVITIDNSEITSAELTESANFQFYRNSWTTYSLEPTLSADGKTITLVAPEDLKTNWEYVNAGDCKIIVYANSIKFNGDDTKVNGLMVYEYVKPEIARYNAYSSYPQPGKVSALSNFKLYFYDSGATVTAAEPAEDLSNVCHLQLFDPSRNQWYPVVFFDSTIIPSEQDSQYGGWSYPGVELTLMEGYENMTFVPGEYKLVCPLGAFVVKTRDEEWQPSQTMDSQYFEMAYTVAAAPEINRIATWGFEDGAVLESFSETTVTFAGITTAEYIDEYDDSLLPVLYRIEADGSQTQLGTLNFGVFNEDMWGDDIVPTAEGTFPIYMRSNKFEPYYPMDVDGEYKIVVKEGCLMFDGFNDIVNGASEITFKINNPSILKQDYATIDPAACEITAYPEKLVVTFENDAIETLEIGLVNTYVGWDSENYCDIYEMLPAKAEMIMAMEHYSWACGKYDMTINPENPKQVILTPDPSSISADAQLSYGNYKFRIPRGGLIANKGTETECTNSILEFGTYSNPQRWTAAIASPNAEEEQSSLFGFVLDLTDNYGYNVYENYNGAIASPGKNPAQLFVYDEVRAEWSIYSDLVLAQNEAGEYRNEDGKIEFTLPYYPVETSGRYKVVIPNDAVVFEYYGSNMGITACEAEYVLKSDVAPYTVETDPAQGDVPFIDDIKVTFTDSWMSGAYIYAWPAEKAAAAFDKDGNLVAYANMTTEYAADWSMYHLIDFEPPITDLGEYRVVVASDVICTDYDGVGDNESFELNFNVIGGDPVLTVTPADGEKVKELTKFAFTWAGATSLEVDPELMVGGAKLYAVNGDDKVLQSELICAPAGTKSATLDVMDLSTPMLNGQYVLEIPEGLFTVNGKAIEAMSFNYTLEAVTYSAELVDGSLAKVILTANYCSEIKDASDGKSEITLWYMTGGEEKIGAYTMGEPNGNSVELTLNETVEFKDGDYVIWIPESMLWVDNDMNADTKISIVYSSVDSIVGDDSNFDVYSVNGMIIKRNANKADVKDLDPGIYVINGKKVLVK